MASNTSPFGIVLAVFIAVSIVLFDIRSAEAQSQVVAVAQDDYDLPDPNLVVLFAMFFPGAGHIYVGDNTTGLLILALSIANIVLIVWLIPCVLVFLLGLDPLLCYLFWFAGLFIQTGLAIWDITGAKAIARRLRDKARQERKRQEDESAPSSSSKPSVRRPQGAQAPWPQPAWA